MITIRNLINRIKQGVDELKANREAESLIIAHNQIALLKFRIQSRGEDSTGNQFAPYTPDYAKQRKDSGYQISFVDFTRTGRTLASLKATVSSSNVFSATVEIGPDNDESAAIIRGLSGKRGDILEPSAEELDLLREANRNRVQKYFNI